MNKKGIPEIDPLDRKAIFLKRDRIPGIFKVGERVNFRRTDKKRIRSGNGVE